MLAWWTGSERESHWFRDNGHNLDTQAILNLYHASSEWAGLESWLSRENKRWRQAAALYKKIVKHSELRARGVATNEEYDISLSMEGL